MFSSSVALSSVPALSKCPCARDLSIRVADTHPLENPHFKNASSYSPAHAGLLVRYQGQRWPPIWLAADVLRTSTSSSSQCGISTLQCGYQVFFCFFLSSHLSKVSCNTHYQLSSDCSSSIVSSPAADCHQGYIHTSTTSHSFPQDYSNEATRTGRRSD